MELDICKTDKVGKQILGGAYGEENEKNHALKLSFVTQKLKAVDFFSGDKNLHKLHTEFSYKEKDYRRAYGRACKANQESSPCAESHAAAHLNNLSGDKCNYNLEHLYSKCHKPSPCPEGIYAGLEVRDMVKLKNAHLFPQKPRKPHTQCQKQDY